MFNYLGLFNKEWVKQKDTNRLIFIFISETPSKTMVIFVREICDIRLQKLETHRFHLTLGGNLIIYQGKVSIPAADLSTVKLKWNRITSNPN